MAGVQVNTEVSRATVLLQGVSWGRRAFPPGNSHAESLLGETALSQMQGSENTAHLKGKLSSLTETCRQLHENLNTHKKEVQILRSEKETLENVLTMKCQDTRKALTNELHRVVEEINRHYGVMRAESVRLNQQLGNLKTEKTALEKEIVRMTKRIEELEDAIGKDSDEDK